MKNRIAAYALLLAVPLLAMAQDFPSKPIRIFSGIVASSRHRNASIPGQVSRDGARPFLYYSDEPRANSSELPLTDASPGGLRLCGSGGAGGSIGQALQQHGHRPHVAVDQVDGGRPLRSVEELIMDRVDEPVDEQHLLLRRADPGKLLHVSAKGLDRTAAEQPLVLVAPPVVTPRRLPGTVRAAEWIFPGLPARSADPR